jgi:predicted Zn-dependent protease
MGHDYRVSLARPLCLVLALCACAWFAIGIRDTHYTNQAASILSVSSSLSPSAARHVDFLLDRAGLLNPDRQVTLLRGQLALARGQSAEAQRIFQGVVNEEPKNIVAWNWLRQAARPGSRVARLAFFHMLLLDPPIK